MTPGNATNTVDDLQREAPWALLYFALYLAYLFIRPENEFLHWLTLVVLPIAGIYFLRKSRLQSSLSFSSLLASVGLERKSLKNGIIWAVVIGLGLSGLQLYLSRDGRAILEILKSGKGFSLFPLALGLMALTAGFTEEFFFRGVLQTRLQRLLKSNIMAVLITSFMFGIYHLPYAYLNPRWPSHGNWPEAISSAFGQGIPMGLILGTLYARTKNNLLSCVILHSLVNSFPAMLIFKL